MPVSIDTIHHVLQNTILIDDESRSNNTHLVLAMLSLLLPYSITFTKFARSVCQQFYLETVFTKGLHQIQWVDP